MDNHHIFICHSLFDHLCAMKNKIGLIDESLWDTFKKWTNPYEHTPEFLLPCSGDPPLSRSYYKMMEIMKHYCISHFLNLQNEPIKTFHLAEGPGGFIEAMVNFRKNPNDLYYGMTLGNTEKGSSSSSKIPGWKKSQHFLRKNPNVIIEYGKDQTGNLLSMDNFMDCCEKYNSSMNFITGDGGFDFSKDFNRQETNMVELLFAQTCFALCMIQPGGIFVLKIFDCFTKPTIDILFLLCSLFEQVYITKPKTSRYANSEKYVVCKKAMVITNIMKKDFICRAYSTMMNLYLQGKKIDRFLSIDIPFYFLQKVEEMNFVLGQQQLENIHQTILLIDKKKRGGGGGENNRW